MLVHQYANPVPPKRVLLLGANGFLARVLRRQLEAAGTPVRALGSSDLDLTSAEAADALSGAIQPDDAVVMASALTPDKGRDIGTLMKNLRMAVAVCDALQRERPAHFLYISSDGVYDGRYSSLLNEDSTCEPTDLYTLMHVAREKMLAQACQAAKIPLAIVRPCAIYGSGDTHNSYGPNRFVRTAIKDGKITLFGGGEERRHHVHVEDVARIINLCLLHGSTGTINAVTGEAVSFRDVAEVVAGAVGKNVTVECLPRANPITHRHFDLTALAKAFPGFSAIALKDGIGSMVAA
jgi:nucleoside-diphosphate-sugar epimerase